MSEALAPIAPAVGGRLAGDVLANQSTISFDWDIILQVLVQLLDITGKKVHLLLLETVPVLHEVELAQHFGEVTVSEVSTDVLNCIPVWSEGIPRGAIVDEDHFFELLANHLQHDVEVVPIFPIGYLLNFEDFKHHVFDDRIL